jgi:hypothetical protein
MSPRDLPWFALARGTSVARARASAHSPTSQVAQPSIGPTPGTSDGKPTRTAGCAASEDAEAARQYERLRQQPATGINGYS